jgi:hypothetical protein
MHKKRKKDAFHEKLEEIMIKPLRKTVKPYKGIQMQNEGRRKPLDKK